MRVIEAVSPAQSAGIVSPREGEQVAGMQRRRLLLAVGELIGEGGIEAATVGGICEQAGVSRRTFYELFADRDACVLAAFDAQIEQLVDPLLAAFRGPGAWVDRTRAALCLLLDRLDADPDVAQLCIVESLRASPRVLERRRTAVAALVRAVDEGRATARAGVQPPPLTAQAIVGGSLSVIHDHLLGSQDAADPSAGVSQKRAHSRLGLLAGELMAMIVHPYLGAAAARKELARPMRTSSFEAPPADTADPFKGLPIRLTYRTACVLATIANSPGASNRYIGRASGIADPGQTSRLLARLRNCGLAENRAEGQPRGEANAWVLSERGAVIHAAIRVREQ